jgi:hypothetical protein
MAKYTQDIHWNDTPVEVNFYFTEGYEAKTWALPEDCYEGVDDEWEIESIMYKGVDVLPLFSEADYDRVIEILNEIREDNDDPF